MTVHMIRVFTSTSGMTESEVQTAISNWVGNHTEWLNDTMEHQIRLVNASEDGTGTDYFRGGFRFELADVKDNLLQNCTDKLKNNVDWFRLVYHQCDHDESARGGCGWDERWNWEASGVSVPSDVEALVPEPGTVVNA